MSFSNTSTGDKPADPYTAANKDEPSLDDKVTTLVDFVTAAKFGMLTTRTSSGKLVSRAMAVAAKENGGIDLLFHVCAFQEEGTLPLLLQTFANSSSDRPTPRATRPTRSTATTTST